MNEASFRRIATAVLVGVGATSALLAESELISAIGGWTTVAAQSRSTLPMFGQSSLGRIAKRSVRVGVCYLPARHGRLRLGPLSKTNAVLGLAIGAAGLAAQNKEVRLGLSARYLRLLPPITAVERLRDVMFHAMAGPAQEFLYRGSLQPALAELVGAWSVPLTTVAFLGEHLLQYDAREQWDRKDLALQASLSMACGAATLATRSYLSATIAHGIYNTPALIQTLARKPEPPQAQGPRSTAL